MIITFYVEYSSPGKKWSISSNAIFNGPKKNGPGKKLYFEC